MFKHHRYPNAIILQAVYYKLRFTLSYRDIEELMQIRGVEVDHSTLQRWVFKFAPAIEKNMHKRKRQVCSSWRMDETYIKVGGKDRYLYRAVDKFGNTVDYLRCCFAVPIDQTQNARLSTTISAQSGW